jgi:hypothetical protein
VTCTTDGVATPSAITCPAVVGLEGSGSESGSDSSESGSDATAACTDESAFRVVGVCLSYLWLGVIVVSTVAVLVGTGAMYADGMLCFAGNAAQRAKRNEERRHARFARQRAANSGAGAVKAKTSDGEVAFSQ